MSNESNINYCCNDNTKLLSKTQKNYYFNENKKLKTNTNFNINTINNINNINIMDYLKIYEKIFNSKSIENFIDINTYENDFKNLYNLLKNIKLNEKNVMINRIINEFNNTTNNINTINNTKNSDTINNTNNINILYKNILDVEKKIINELLITIIKKIISLITNFLKNVNSNNCDKLEITIKLLRNKNILDDIKLIILNSFNECKINNNNNNNNNSNDKSSILYNIENIIIKNKKIKLFLNTCLYDEIVLKYLLHFIKYQKKIIEMKHIFKTTNIRLDKDFNYKAIKMYLCLIFNIDLINNLNGIILTNKIDKELYNFFDIFKYYKYNKIIDDTNKIIDYDDNLIFFICMSYTIIDSIIDENSYLVNLFHNNNDIKYNVSISKSSNLKINIKKIKLLILHYLYILIVKLNSDLNTHQFNNFHELLKIIKENKEDLYNLKYNFLYYIYFNINTNEFKFDKLFDIDFLNFSKSNINEIIIILNKWKKQKYFINKNTLIDIDNINNNLNNNNLNNKNINNNNLIGEYINDINIYLYTIDVLDIYLNLINKIFVSLLDCFIININKQYIEYLNIIYLLTEITNDINTKNNLYHIFNDDLSVLDYQNMYNINNNNNNNINHIIYEEKFVKILKKKLLLFLKVINYAFFTELECNKNQKSILDVDYLIRLTNKKGLSTLYLTYISLINNNNDIINNIFIKPYKSKQYNIKQFNLIQENSILKKNNKNINNYKNNEEKTKIIQLYLPFNKIIDKVLLNDYIANKLNISHDNRYKKECEIFLICDSNNNLYNNNLNSHKIVKNINNDVKNIIKVIKNIKYFIDYCAIFTQLLDDLSDFKTDLSEKIITSSMYYLLENEIADFKNKNVFKKLLNRIKQNDSNTIKYKFINDIDYDFNKLVDNFNRTLLLNIMIYNKLYNYIDSNILKYLNETSSNTLSNTSFNLDYNRISTRLKYYINIYKYYINYIIFKHNDIVYQFIKNKIKNSFSLTNISKNLFINKVEYKNIINNIE